MVDVEPGTLFLARTIAERFRYFRYLCLCYFFPVLAVKTIVCQFSQTKTVYRCRISKIVERKKKNARKGLNLS